MEKDKLILKAKVFKNGNNGSIIIPKPIVEFLNIVPGEDTLEITVDIGKHGKFAAFWKMDKIDEVIQDDEKN